MSISHRKDLLQVTLSQIYLLTQFKGFTAKSLTEWENYIYMKV